MKMPVDQLNVLVRHHFHDIILFSWNVSGINVHDNSDQQRYFVDRVFLEANSGIMCFQEFSQSVEDAVVLSKLCLIYVFPGIFKASRSNCIAFSKELEQLVCLDDACRFGVIAYLDFGNCLISIISLRLP